MPTAMHPRRLDLLDAARFLDVIVVVLAAPFVLVAGAPVLGCFAGAAGWIVSRLAGELIERRAKASDDVRTQTGLTLFSSLGRAWLVGLVILAVGVAGEREDGLTAALLVLVAFTLYLVTAIALRAGGIQEKRSPRT